MTETPSQRAPDLTQQLAEFNEFRRGMVNGQPITPEERLPLPPTGVGGDVDE